MFVTVKNLSNIVETYAMDKEEKQSNDWSMYTKVEHKEVDLSMCVEYEQHQHEESDMTGYDLEAHGIYNTEDRTYTNPVAVWNKVYQEYWYVESSSQMRQINESYNRAFDIDKSDIGTREDGDWVTTNRMVRAEDMLLELGVSQQKINQAIKMTNSCFLADARYRDFRDDLSDFIMEDVLANTENWIKMEEAEVKIADLKSVLIEKINSIEKLDEAIIEYALTARKRAWTHVKNDMTKKGIDQPNWELYNTKKSEYSQALMKKVTKKVGYQEKDIYMKLMSYVGTRYWQVALGRTREQLQERARWTCFQAVSELLGATFSEYFNEHNQEVGHVDNWTTDFDHMHAECMRDMDQNQARELILVNELYRQMDDMQYMNEKERNSMLINR